MGLRIGLHYGLAGMVTMIALGFPGIMSAQESSAPVSQQSPNTPSATDVPAQDARCTDLSGRFSQPCPEKETGTPFSTIPAQTSALADTDSVVGNTGAVYVPLDSWVYPAFDRLAALGYAPSAFAGLRPWTRTECVRLLEEIQGLLSLNENEWENSGDASRLYRLLETEFSADSRSTRSGLNFGVESVYTRFLGITGTPLQDGYHFSRTVVNDFGRPFAEGANLVSGASAWAALGPFSLYARGEYQRAPGVANPIERPLERTVADEFALSFLPPHVPIPRVSRFQLMEAYASLNHNGWELSFGRQSLLWGPGRGGAFLWNNSALPVDMLRISRTSPLKLPWILGWLGPVRAESLVGRLSGHQFAYTQTGSHGEFGVSLERQPYVYAQKFSFKPTPNLEFGFSRSGVFGGPDYPLTLRSLRRAFLSRSTLNAADDAGDRRSAFDFSYRLPGLRKWVLLYSDSMAEDEYSPIAYPRRSAIRPGLYFPQLPKLPRLDFRIEGPYTDLPGLQHWGYFYWNLRYVDGYTNQGNTLGHWVGRQGRGLQMWSTLWLSARSTVELGYRSHRVSPEFLKGGSLKDGSARADIALGNQVRLTVAAQYERWNFPLLVSRTMSNFSMSAQLTLYPKWRMR
ncbi:MAG: capsule assembly Wzi family protein [Candidatus Korobacteraceae bacterium]